MMISVENFYWILDKHLLQPTGLHRWYYFPWGTQDHFSQWECSRRKSRSDMAHVLFYFDQEPIYNDSLGQQYDQIRESWGFHTWAKFLANSEKSQYKKHVCQSRHMLDWYYFYHGFASLDWYRDAQFIDDENPIKTAYLCLNNLVQHRRSYRIALLARLLERNCTDGAAISFHANTSDVQNELQDSQTRLTAKSQDIIRRNLNHMDTMPWILDRSQGFGALSAAFGPNEHRLWQQSFLHVVTETVFYEPKLHLTEKIFKPIVALRPFILVAAPGNLAYLRDYGFRTFDRWIDESYDRLPDPDQRLDAIASEIMRIHSMPLAQLQAMLLDMTEITHHNRRHFFGRFREIITEELVDNFDQCIRIWNNGRVDDHGVRPHPYLADAKCRLLA